jgi:SNF2 family DNA or RNA helicase
MKKFAVCLTRHRVFGQIFIPVVFRQFPDKEYFTIDERIHSSNLRKFEHELQKDELQLVNLIEEYADNQLIKIFSRKKTSLQNFLATLDEHLLRNQIRPYIEKRLLKCIEILQGSETRVYKKDKMSNVYESDRIELLEEPVETVFNFKRANEELCYFLSIRQDEQEIKLFGKKGIILVNEPCCLVLDNCMYTFEDIDGKKLLPFFNKEFIQVPRKTEKKFLEEFVRNVIKNYRVNTDGFKIVDKKVHPTAILSLETNLSGSPVFVLMFKYDEETIYYANKKSELKVVLKEEKGENIFYRLGRDHLFENNIIYQLLELGLKNTGNSCFQPLKLKKKENILLHYELVNWLNFNAEELKEKGVEVIQQNKTTRFYLNRFELKTKVTDDKNDWFDINIVVKFSDFEIPFIKFRNHILNDNRQYILPDNEIVILPEEWFARFKDIFAFAHIENDRITLEKTHFVLIQEGLKGYKDWYAGKLKKWFDDLHDSGFIPPVRVNAKLRPYQLKGYNWMFRLYENNFGGCLADDMGLGKTLQTLALLAKVIQEENLKIYGPVVSNFDRQLTIFDRNNVSAIMKSRPSLIIVPTSLVYNWINEIMKFIPDLKVSVYGGQHRKPLKHYYNNFEVIITSYGIVRNDVEEFRSFDFLYIILDESQLVKNPFSKTFKALMQLKSSYRLVLTGTPIENSLLDLWSQMNFLNPGLLGSYEFFKNEFLLPIEKHQSEDQAKKLKKLVNPFIMRRKKSEVARDLPELSEQLIFCDMSEVQSSFYEKEKSKARNIVLQNIGMQGVEKSSIIILQSITRLRQIANHPVLVSKEFPDHSGKFDEITRNLESIVAEGHKALVFSSFVKHLDLFAGFCDDHKLSYTYLTGDTTNRGEIVRQFQDNADIKIFLISLRAGGFGLNLTAADYVFLLDPWWNPAVEQQALSRAHRIGQDKNVFVYRFIAKDSIEEKILKLQEKKSKLADMFVNTSNPFSGISEQEILELFE